MPRGRPPGKFRQQANLLIQIVEKDLLRTQAEQHNGTDRYFATALQVTPRQVRSYLLDLKQKGLVEVVSKSHKLGPSTWANVRSIRLTPKEP